MHLFLLLVLALAGFLELANRWVDDHTNVWYPNSSYNTEVNHNDYH